MTSDQPPVDSPNEFSERLDIQLALRVAQLGVWEIDPLTNVVNWDDRCGELVGMACTSGLTYEQVLSQIHPDDRERVDKAVKWALNPQSDGAYDSTYRTLGVDDGQLRWVRFVGQRYATEAGEVYRFAGVAQEVSREVQERQRQERLEQQLRETQHRLELIVEHSPVAYALFRGPQFIIELANDRVLEYWKRERAEVLHKPLFEAIPEASQQGFEELLTGVYTTGERFMAKEMPAILNRNGQFEQTYLELVYEPYYEADENTGKPTITGVTVVCVDITEQVLARKRIEASEAKLRAVVEKSSIPIAVYVGQEMRIELANQPMIDAFGKGPDVLGRRFADVLPEMEEQGIFALLDEVYKTGIPCHIENRQLDIRVGSRVIPHFYTYSYIPLPDAAGQVYGVLNTAIDVTKAVLARQEIEESEARFRQLVEQAPAAMLVVKGEELVIETINQAMLTIMGRGTDIVGKPLEVAMPELLGQVLPIKCRGVLHTGISYNGLEDEAQVFRNGRLEIGYYNVSYTPLYDGSVITGVMQVAT
ncbi:MAG TPA: PAS domain S-box protein, partial [Fibrella sp.]